MHQPALSVVIPVYNGERYLSATLDSVLAQGFSDFELIVIDDGSTDSTPDILLAYSGDPRVRSLTLNHVGVAAALKLGVAAANSDLIVRIDSDDLMEPQRLQRQLTYMAHNPEIGGAGSYYLIIDEAGELRGSHESPWLTPEDLQRYLQQGGRPIFPAPTMIFRRSLALAVGSYREEFKNCEDVDLFLRMIEAGYPILIQPEYLTRFRYHPNSESGRNTREQFHYNEIIFGNYRRRQAGMAEVTIDRYTAHLATLSRYRKFCMEARILSAVLLRRREMAKLAGRRMASMLLLVGAAVLDLGRTYNKARRRVLSGHSDGPGGRVGGWPERLRG